MSHSKPKLQSWKWSADYFFDISWVAHALSSTTRITNHLSKKVTISMTECTLQYRFSNIPPKCELPICFETFHSIIEHSSLSSFKTLFLSSIAQYWILQFFLGNLSAINKNEVKALILPYSCVTRKWRKFQRTQFDGKLREHGKWVWGSGW
jgi:hypothetical protein